MATRRGAPRARSPRASSRCSSSSASWPRSCRRAGFPASTSATGSPRAPARWSSCPCSSAASAEVERLLAHLEVQALGNLDPHDPLRDPQRLQGRADAHVAGRRRDPGRGGGRDRGAQPPARARRRTTASSSSTAIASGTRRKASSWAGSASGGRSRSSTACCAAPTDTSFSVKVGDLSILPSVRYVLTLDADTRLPRDAARTLIGILAHPLNRPVVDAGPAAGSRRATASSSRA